MPGSRGRRWVRGKGVLTGPIGKICRRAAVGPVGPGALQACQKRKGRAKHGSSIAVSHRTTSQPSILRQFSGHFRGVPFGFPSRKVGSRRLGLEPRKHRSRLCGMGFPIKRPECCLPGPIDKDETLRALSELLPIVSGPTGKLSRIGALGTAVAICEKEGRRFKCQIAIPRKMWSLCHTP